MSKRKLILEAGHSGSAFGHYFTAGKRSPDPSIGIYEGEFNRSICALVEHQLNDCVFLNPGPINIPLKTRVEWINKIAAKTPCVLLSVHGNAAPGSGWSKAKGTTVFTRKAPDEESESFALSLSEDMEDYTPLESRGLKQVGFRILRTGCPSVLLECGFMTNKEDAAYMATYKGKQDIAEAIVDAYTNTFDGE